MPTLDLKKPGKFWASADNEAETIFHLVIPGPNYTKDKLTQNPAISPGDQLMAPWKVSGPEADTNGNKAELDLAKSGRAKQILDKLTQRFEKGLPALKQVRGVVIVTATNEDKKPPKQLADVVDLELAPIPAIKVEGVRTFVTVQNFKAGQKEFLVKVTAQGLEQLQLTAAGGEMIPWGPKHTMAVSDGQTVTVKVKVPFVQRNDREERRVKKRYRHYVPGGWRTKSYGDWTTATFTREVWTGGDITLTASGTGDFAGIKKSVKLRAENWASAWLCRNPPPVLRHNIC